MPARFALIAALAALVLPAPAALALTDPPRRDAQGDVRRDVRAGTVLRVREIEQRVLPTKQGMQYLGPEYDPVAMAYRLKFIRDGHVVFVDVDARSGEILGESR